MHSVFHTAPDVNATSRAGSYSSTPPSQQTCHTSLNQQSSSVSSCRNYCKVVEAHLAVCAKQSFNSYKLPSQQHKRIGLPSASPLVVLAPQDLKLPAELCHLRQANSRRSTVSNAAHTTHHNAHTPAAHTAPLQEEAGASIPKHPTGFVVACLSSHDQNAS